MNDYQKEQQEQSIDSGDPCVVVMCMFGKATGNSGGEQCSSPEKTFFNIIKKKKGSFLPNHTSDARKAFISKCDTATPDVLNKIVGVFGKVKL
ncbi:KikA protein [Buttiauxella sp. B2]|nr:KikA protein [Buttiauxella sp. B2]